MMRRVLYAVAVTLMTTRLRARSPMSNDFIVLDLTERCAAFILLIFTARAASC